MMETISYSIAQWFKKREKKKDSKRFISSTFVETVWEQIIDSTTVLQTLIAGSEDANNDTILFYTVQTVDSDEHWHHLLNQITNWTTREEMATHLQ